MRTAVDSSVLLDVFGGSGPFVRSAQSALREATAKGSLVVCDVVWAEVRAHFASEAKFRQAMDALGLLYDPPSIQSASEAGRAWSAYLRSGGKRKHLIPDFLVAAHGLTQVDVLLTRDRGFSRRYFKKLRVWDPSAK